MYYKQKWFNHFVGYVTHTQHLRLVSHAFLRYQPFAQLIINFFTQHYSKLVRQPKYISITTGINPNLYEVKLLLQ